MRFGASTRNRGDRGYRWIVRQAEVIDHTCRCRAATYAVSTSRCDGFSFRPFRPPLLLCIHSAPFVRGIRMRRLVSVSELSSDFVHSGAIAACTTMAVKTGVEVRKGGWGCRWRVKNLGMFVHFSDRWCFEAPGWTGYERIGADWVTRKIFRGFHPRIYYFKCWADAFEIAERIYFLLCNWLIYFFYFFYFLWHFASRKAALAIVIVFL